MENEVIFGSKKDFGIRYIPGWKSKNSNHEFATLHLLLRGQIIGSPIETCLLGSWLFYVQNTLGTILTNSEKLHHKEFENRTDNEVFQMLIKSNQQEEDYEEKFKYLPILHEDIWIHSNISIDETIDAYYLFMTSKNDELRFLWQGWRDPCPLDQIGILNSVVVEKEKVIETIIECLHFVRKDIVNYKPK